MNNNNEKKLTKKMGFFEKIKKNKFYKNTGDDSSGSSGGSTEGIEFDWNLLAQSQLDSPIGPDEKTKTHQEVLPYSIPSGVRDIAKQKEKTYAAQKAKESISKGDRAAQHMHHVETQREMEHGPQGNANPLG
jgi:hypothetical protein